MANGTVRSYKDLSVWQKAMDLVQECYRVTESFPRAEEFGLKSQIRRAAVSIPFNIAEGSVRHSSNEYARFLAIALGSTAELETQIEHARRLVLHSGTEAERLAVMCQEVGKMLNGLRRSISRNRFA
jgi:four helix bundle protein